MNILVSISQKNPDRNICILLLDIEFYRFHKQAMASLISLQYDVNTPAGTNVHHVIWTFITLPLVIFSAYDVSNNSFFL